MRRVEWSVIYTDLLIGSAPQTVEEFALRPATSLSPWAGLFCRLRGLGGAIC